MDYIELEFVVEPTEDFKIDILMDELADIGFETFENTEEGFKAFIKVDDFDEEKVHVILFQSGLIGSFTKTLIPHKNWNEVWESNFEPLIISEECYVRATFHTPQPAYPYEIVIDPKMAFGTGHHETTTLMMRFILKQNCVEKEVLDMGCGTGILAILAAKRGAKNIVAIDSDELCFESTKENSLLNKVVNILPLCGSKEIIPQQLFDIIAANINRNILIDQLSTYKEKLRKGGVLFLSGFYLEDLEAVKKEAELNNIQFVEYKEFNNWIAVKFTKLN